jgi:hypothetical protein
VCHRLCVIKSCRFDQGNPCLHAAAAGMLCELTELFSPMLHCNCMFNLLKPRCCYEQQRYLSLLCASWHQYGLTDGLEKVTAGNFLGVICVSCMLVPISLGAKHYAEASVWRNLCHAGWQSGSRLYLLREHRQSELSSIACDLWRGVGRLSGISSPRQSWLQ